MQRLRIAKIPKKRIKPIETTSSRIVISRPEILLPDLGVKLLATVQEFGKRICHDETESVSIGVKRVYLGDGTDTIGQNPCASVTVKREVIFLRDALIIRYNLRNALESDNVCYALCDRATLVIIGLS